MKTYILKIYLLLYNSLINKTCLKFMMQYLIVESVGLTSAWLSDFHTNDLSAIRREHGRDTAACLREGLCLWLQSGKATWRVLVDTVANSSGGNDLTLALEIARKHEGMIGMPILS